MPSTTIRPIRIRPNPQRRAPLPPAESEVTTIRPCCFCNGSCNQTLDESGIACPAISNIGRIFRLTPRENQVLWLVCQGLKNDAIAGQLEISSPTVRLHLRNLHFKMSTADKVELVLKVWQQCVAHANRTVRPTPIPADDMPELNYT